MATWDRMDKTAKAEEPSLLSVVRALETGPGQPRFGCLHLADAKRSDVVTIRDGMIQSATEKLVVYFSHG